VTKTTWIIIGIIAALALGVAIVLFIVGQNAQTAAIGPTSPELPAGSSGSREAGIFSTIWAGVGQITGGVISAATSNEDPTGGEA
jgi:hypothetical protein